MFNNRSIKALTSAALLIVLVIMSFAVVSAAPAYGPGDQSTEDVAWFWDAAAVTGDAKLVRGPNGISANFKTSELPAGQAVTLWFIVFNNPAGCNTSPCSVPADVFNPAAEADFLWGGGHVTGGSGRATFAGHLAVGDTSGSGMTEIGFPELALGLTDPAGAEVHLALHSHGPKLTGQALVAQLSSFTGGCNVFLGPDGFAAGPGDVPDEVGECSTIQQSTHQATP